MSGRNPLLQYCRLTTLLIVMQVHQNKQRQAHEELGGYNMRMVYYCKLYIFYQSYLFPIFSYHTACLLLYIPTVGVGKEKRTIIGP